jgi:plastocyanin
MNDRIGIALRIALLGVAVVGCGGGGKTGSQVTAEANSPSISATDLTFDRAELDVPAGRPFTLVIENRDSAPHNLAIYRDANATDTFFKGEVFTGPGSRVYAVPQLSQGTWYFRCDVHTEMQGTVVATSG